MRIKIIESSNSHLIPREITLKPESWSSYYPFRALKIAVAGTKKNREKGNEAIVEYFQFMTG
jgi:hypothetical protein